MSNIKATIFFGLIISDIALFCLNTGSIAAGFLLMSMVANLCSLLAEIYQCLINHAMFARIIFSNALILMFMVEQAYIRCTNFNDIQSWYLKITWVSQLIIYCIYKNINIQEYDRTHDDMMTQIDNLTVNISRLQNLVNIISARMDHTGRVGAAAA